MTGGGAQRDSGQDQYRGHVDVPAVWHRPLNGLARVVGRVLEELGPARMSAERRDERHRARQPFREVTVGAPSRADDSTAVRERDDRFITVVGRRGTEELGTTPCSQDPACALVTESPSSVTDDTVTLQAGSIKRFTLQRLHGIAPQAHDLHDRLRI